MKLLLRIKYDGSDYCGYQYQPGLPTVQGELTHCVSRALGMRCTVTGCSRTDAGVHALGYCAAVEPAEVSQRGSTWLRIPAERVHRAVGAYLPPSIAVTGAAMVSDTFHPRYSAVAKEYIYVINDSPVHDPFLFGKAYRFGRHITDDGIFRMREAASGLVGRHDFSAFMASGSDVKDTVRELYKLDVRRVSDGLTVVTAKADGFLYNMVRILVGTLLDSASGRLDPREIGDILSSCRRERAGFTAPACGLYLRSVDYRENIEFSAM